MRVEDEPSILDLAKQDVTEGRTSAGSCGRERDRIGEVDARALRVREPAPEQHDRFEREALELQRLVVLGGHGAPPAGFEPAPPAPEAGALSPELRGLGCGSVATALHALRRGQTGAILGECPTLPRPACCSPTTTPSCIGSSR